jgi:hypothetical protein
MSGPNRILVLSAIVLGLCPAVAFACEDEASKTAAQASAAAKATACLKATACVKATGCTIKVKALCTEATTTAVSNELKCTIKAINTQGARHSGWEPGHLIEPDSMKLGPDLDGPDSEQWVILSSVAGVIHLYGHPWKKTECPTLQQYGPFRVLLSPQAP